MTTYVNVFGEGTVSSVPNSFAAYTLTANTEFYWPEHSSSSNLMAEIMEVTSGAAYDLQLPDATAVGQGKDFIIRNTGAFDITVKDQSDGAVATVSAGVVKYFYLKDNSTVAGTWAVITFGTGTSAADASALAGSGLRAILSELAQDFQVASSSANYTVATSDRATIRKFTNSGSVTCSLPATATAGNGFFLGISNQGTGTVVIDGNSTDTIDGQLTKSLAPGESLLLICDGSVWVSVGYGRSTDFQFTALIYDISSGTPFTLTSTEAGNKLLQFIGTLTAAVEVILPAVVGVYYIQASYTGAYNCTVKTAAGTGVALTSGDRTILYCDGTDVVSAQTASVPAANLSGGVAGSVVYQSATGVTAFTAAGTSGQLLQSGGTGAPSFTSSPNLGTATASTINGSVIPTSKTLVVTTDVGSVFQAWSSNLDEYAAVNPTPAGLALLDDADAAAQRTTLGLGTLATQSGTFSGTSSGTNTGDQTIALTGDVTGSGTGSFAATIANDAVTYAKMQNVSATDKLLGRSTAGAGDVEEITCTAFARSILDDANEATFKATVNLEIGVDVQAYDADLTTWAGVTPGTGVAAALAVNIGSAGAPVVLNGALGTPSSGVATNLTGTAAGLTAGNVTTNANLTGHVTSVGNAAVLGSFTIAQLNTAVSDANLVPTGSVTSSGLTQNTSRILGRTTAAAGAIEEITIGSGLTLSAGSLSASTTGGLTLGTQQASTSGTAIDFTGIPAGTKRIMVMFDDVSTGSNGAPLLLRLGGSGGIEATGYVCYTNATTATDGFLVSDEGNSSDKRCGIVTLCLMNAASFKWCMSGTVGASNTPAGDSIGGIKTLASELTQLRITTASGATFDNGSINILYE